MYEPINLAGLLKIFTFNKKRELEKYCREAVVYSPDFVKFIRACDAGRMPFQHRIHPQPSKTALAEAFAPDNP
jgi:hypothetical protein